MEITYTIDGNPIQWRPHLQKNNKQEENKSSGHKVALSILRELYPTLIILEEITIPIRAKDWAFLDIYIPLLKMAIEINGQQHYKFNAHFHSTNRDFLLQKLRDKQKREWCTINNIKLIELNTKEQNQWKKILQNHNSKE